MLARRGIGDGCVRAIRPSWRAARSVRRIPCRAQAAGRHRGAGGGVQERVPGPPVAGQGLRAPRACGGLGGAQPQPVGGGARGRGGRRRPAAAPRNRPPPNRRWREPGAGGAPVYQGATRRPAGEVRPQTRLYLLDRLRCPPARAPNRRFSLRRPELHVFVGTLCPKVAENRRFWDKLYVYPTVVRRVLAAAGARPHPARCNKLVYVYLTVVRRPLAAVAAGTQPIGPRPGRPDQRGRSAHRGVARPAPGNFRRPAPREVKSGPFRRECDEVGQGVGRWVAGENGGW